MYYFLDIDGVLNNEKDWSRPFSINKACVACFRESLSYDEEPHIILSSTWRAGITNTGNKLCAGEDQKYIAQLGLHIEGATPLSNKTRQEEIEYYIRRNKVLEYLVIDDDRTLFPRANEMNIYFTNYKTGLVSADVRKIMKLLKRIK